MSATTVSSSSVAASVSTAYSVSPSSPYGCCACIFNSSNSTNGSSNSTTTADSNSLFYLGVGLAVGNCAFIGTSYVISKKALMNYQAKQGRSGSYSGVGYLREWLWWVGLLLLGVGELSNFLAYSFAPAALVTPLEGLSVVVSVILAYFWLRENLNVYGQIGVFLSLLGAVIVVLLAPQGREFTTLDELIHTLTSPGVLVLMGLLIFYMIFFAAYMGPRYGDSVPFIFLSIASAGGPITVFGCKGVGLAVSDTAAGVNQFANWITWVMIVVMLLGVLAQIYYVNRTLVSFPATVVTPAYFVIFTSFVLVTSGITFGEYSSMQVPMAVAMICGFVVIAVGIIIINVFKDEECTWAKVRRLIMQKNADLPKAQGENGAANPDVLGVEAGVNNAAATDNASPKKKKRIFLKLHRMKDATADVIKKRKLSEEDDKFSNCLVSRNSSSVGTVNPALDIEDGGSPAKANAYTTLSLSASTTRPEACGPAPTEDRGDRKSDSDMITFAPEYCAPPPDWDLSQPTEPFADGCGKEIC